MAGCGSRLASDQIKAMILGRCTRTVEPSPVAARLLLQSATQNMEMQRRETRREWTLRIQDTEMGRIVENVAVLARAGAEA